MKEILCVRHLRRDHPDWSWRAVRAGMGWRYEGHKGTERVTIMANGVITGPSDDDIGVAWYVYETKESYASWCMRNDVRRVPKC